MPRVFQSIQVTYKKIAVYDNAWQLVNPAPTPLVARREIQTGVISQSFDGVLRRMTIGVQVTITTT